MSDEITIDIEQSPIEFKVEQHSLINDFEIDISSPVTKWDVEIVTGGGGLEAVVHNEDLEGDGTEYHPLGLSATLHAIIENKVDKTNVASQIYGTDENGEQTTYDIDILGLVDDVQVKENEDSEYRSVIEDQVAYIDLSGKVSHYNILPQATENNVGQVVQYVGSTTEYYQNGLFYISTHISIPEYVDFETSVEDPEQVVFNEETFLENIQPEQHQIWMLTYNIFDEEGNWYYNGQIVDPANYGITLSGEFEQGDTLRIEYFPEEDEYSWVKKDTTDISEKVDKTHEINRIYGTDDQGNQTTYDKEDFGKVDDVRLNGTSVVTNKIANLDLVASDSEYHNASVVSITNVQEALDNLMNIHYYINPVYDTFTVSQSGNYDVGTVLSQPFTITWSLNKQPVSGDIETLKYEGNTILNIMSLEDQSKWKAGTYTYESDITSNSPRTYTFRIDYTDKHSTVPSGKTGSCSATKTFNFMYRRYWGVTSTETLSDEQLFALSNELSTSRSQERDFNCSGGKYWWFAIPTTYCSGIQFTDVGSGLPMTLPPECISTRTITNSQGVSYSMNVYRGEYKQTASSVKIRVS